LGGVSIDKTQGVLASVLLDLSQTASSSASQEVANYVLKSLGRITRLHKRHVEKAGFAVLKAPDIPSLLVETGFISNPKGEQQLRSARYQNRVAIAILSGIKQYVAKRPQPFANLAHK